MVLPFASSTGCGSWHDTSRFFPYLVSAQTHSLHRGRPVPGFSRSISQDFVHDASPEGLKPISPRHSETDQLPRRLFHSEVDPDGSRQQQRSRSAHEAFAAILGDGTVTRRKEVTRKSCQEHPFSLGGARFWNAWYRSKICT